MLIRFSDLLAPHYCCSCGEIGAILCDYCKYNIISERVMQCISCERLTGGDESLCRQCALPYSRAWCVGVKTDELEKVIEAYKFGRAKSAYQLLAQLLDEVVPLLPDDTIVTAIPTVAAHIRERGYDHAALLARRFAATRRYTYSTPLVRLTKTRQRGASRRQREAQAKEAFRAISTVTGTYLLIDDVFTTGATVKYAAQALHDAGASEVWVVVLARQPFRKD